MGCTQARLCGMCPSWSLCRQLFLKLACKSPCSFQGLGILFYLDLRLAPLRHQKAFMTVKTRNEKCRPGISKAASCQAHRGSSRGLAQASCPVSPIAQRFLIKLGQLNRSILCRLKEATQGCLAPTRFLLPQGAFSLSHTHRGGQGLKVSVPSLSSWLVNGEEDCRLWMQQGLGRL